MEKKYCDKCKEWKEKGDFYKERNQCKECYNRSRCSAYYEWLDEKKKLFKKGKQRCLYCNEIRSLDEFRFMKDTQKYGSQCEKCISVESKKWYEKNKNKILEEAKIKNFTPEEKVKKIKYNKEYKEKNKGILAEKQKIHFTKPEIKEKRAKYKKGYDLKNKDRIREKKIREGLITGNCQSKEEKFIEDYLTKIKEPFEMEKTFDGCKSPKGYELSFDFYLTKKDKPLEYDGIFHFEPIFGIEELQKIKKNDKLKDSFSKLECKGIYRINYKQDLLLLHLPYRKYL